MTVSQPNTAAFFIQLPVISARTFPTCAALSTTLIAPPDRSPRGRVVPPKSQRSQASAPAADGFRLNTGKDGLRGDIALSRRRLHRKSQLRRRRAGKMAGARISGFAAARLRPQSAFLEVSDGFRIFGLNLCQ